MNAHIFWEKVRLTKGEEFSISELAREINVKRSTLNYWIKKGLFPPLNIGFQLANSIGDDLEYLLNGIEPEEEVFNDKLFRLCMHELKEMETSKLLAVLPILKSIRTSDTSIFKNTIN